MNKKHREAWISLKLDQIGEINGAHQFELLCLDFAKARIEPNLLPQTGPVAGGGDRGRDFESFHGPGLVGVCTTQKKDRGRKLRTDIEKAIGHGHAVEKVHCFLSTRMEAPKQNRLEDELTAEFGVLVSIMDRNGLAKNLADSDTLEIAEGHLGIPLLSEALNGPLPRLLGSASAIEYAGTATDSIPEELAPTFHVERDAERELREAFERALGRGGASLVVAEGEPCSGRTHACLRALALAAPGIAVHQAERVEELRSWLTLEHAEPAALLIAPLGPVIGSGGGALLRSQREYDGWRPPLLIVGVEGAEALSPPGERNEIRAPADARVEVNTMLAPHELERARERLAAAGIEEEVTRWGLGPALAAQPALTARFRHAIGAGGDAGSGRTLVEILVAWSRIGMGEELGDRLLRDLHTILASDGLWDEAADWALARVPGGPALARLGEDGWKPHPTLSTMPLRRGWERRWEGDPVWAVLRGWAGEEPGRLASLGTAAHRLGDDERAAAVLGEAIERGSRRARFNLALLRRQSDPKGAQQLLLGLREELRELAPGDAASQQALVLTLRALAGFDQRRPEAAEAYREAALWGDLESVVSLAQLERREGDPRLGLEMVRNAAQAGLPMAAASLILDFGIELSVAAENLDAAGTEAMGALLLRQAHPEDAQRAFALAATAGRLPARAQLGALLLAHDRPAAIEVLEPAVERGSRAATLYLGRALRGVEEQRARGLMRRAYELGSRGAGEELLEMLRSEDSKEARQDAIRLAQELEEP